MTPRKWYRITRQRWVKQFLVKKARVGRSQRKKRSSRNLVRFLKRNDDPSITSYLASEKIHTALLLGYR